MNPADKSSYSEGWKQATQNIVDLLEDLIYEDVEDTVFWTHEQIDMVRVIINKIENGDHECRQFGAKGK